VTAPAGIRDTVPVVNCRSNIASAAPSSRSICPGVGGSIFSCRHRVKNAARSRSREVSTGQISSAIQSISLSSSPTVIVRNW
jgi:hypothetical protein